jgi:tRNA/rRNA methyltransferase
MGENVGFAARSMKNFGLEELRLVSPGEIEEDEWGAGEHNASFSLPSFLEKAEAVAKGGAEVIRNAKIFKTIEEATQDITKIYALSARRREIAKEVITPETAIEEMLQSNEKYAFLFGRESNGLSNKDVTLAHKMIEIEANKSYPSINLGMSVGLISYLIHKKINGSKYKMQERALRNLASGADLSYLIKFLQTKLDDANYFKVAEKREGMMVNIANIFSHANLSQAEVKTLIGIFDLIKTNQ